MSPVFRHETGSSCAPEGDDQPRICKMQHDERGNDRTERTAEVRSQQASNPFPASTELRVAHSSAARMAHLERHRAWLESVLGCQLSAAMIFDLEAPITQFS